jgi:hypothetical protein
MGFSRRDGIGGNGALDYVKPGVNDGGGVVSDLPFPGRIAFAGGKKKDKREDAEGE